MQPIETNNCFLPLKTEESSTENKNTKIHLPNTEITAKTKHNNAATQKQNSNDKAENDTLDKTFQQSSKSLIILYCAYEQTI